MESCKTCLTNLYHTIHIMPLVINALGGIHTNDEAQTKVLTRN